MSDERQDGWYWVKIPGIRTSIPAWWDGGNEEWRSTLHAPYRTVPSWIGLRIPSPDEALKRCRFSECRKSGGCENTDRWCERPADQNDKYDPRHTLKGEEPPAAPVTSQFRVGGKVPLNVYEGDRPVFQCHTPEDAERFVRLLNAGLNKSNTVTLTREQVCRLIFPQFGQYPAGNMELAIARLYELGIEVNE